MKDRQGDLNKRLQAYGLSCVFTVALGVIAAFFSVRLSNFHGFFALSLVSLLLIIFGGGLGMYCWRLLYLSRMSNVSWNSYTVGIFAAFVPAIIMYKIFT